MEKEGRGPCYEQSFFKHTIQYNKLGYLYIDYGARLKYNTI